MTCHLKDQRENALKDIAKKLNLLNIPEIQIEFHGLRTQLGIEMTNMTKTKLNQGYVSILVFWKHVQFLIPIMQPVKSKGSLSCINTESGSDSCCNMSIKAAAKAPKTCKRSLESNRSMRKSMINSSKPLQSKIFQTREKTTLLHLLLRDLTVVINDQEPIAEKNKRHPI